MSMKIESPWGTLDSENPNLFLAGIYLVQKQLMHYKRTGQGASNLNKDIEGYQMLLDSKSNENCRKFTYIKRAAATNGKRFPDNLAVVNHMKETGVWCE